MTTTNHTRRSFLRSIAAELKNAVQMEGFKHVGSNWFEMQVDRDTKGVATFPSAIYPDDATVYINPSVGVTSVPLEELLVRLTGRKQTKYLAATISTSLGYLTPAQQHTMYEFAPEASVTKNVRKLVADVRAYGMPWIRDHSSMQAILQGVASHKFCTKDWARLCLPLIHFVAGDHETSRNELQKGLAELGDKQDTYSEQYRRFAAALQRQINGNPGTDGK